MAYIPWEHDAGNFLIYVDACGEDVFSGRYYRPFDGEGGRFGGLTQLLLQIEQSLNTEEGPQAFQTLRSFWPAAAMQVEELRLPLQRGKVASFSVRILFRRNASWQGSVTWLDEKQTRSFRSVLELITLISGAVAGGRLSVDMRREMSMENAE